MKKLLGLVLVLALVGTLPAKADVLKHVKTSGEIQVLGTWDKNMYNLDPVATSDLNAKYSSASTRVLFGVHAGLTQDVKANLTLAYYNMWGTDNGVLPYGTNGKNIDGYTNAIEVAEANVELFNLFCAIDAKIGRQFYGDEDSAVIYFGPNHYNSEQRNFHQATAIDAAVFNYAGEMLSWTFMYGKLWEGDVTGAYPYVDTDATIAGLDFKAAVNDNFKVQAYIYDLRDERFATDHGGFWGVKPSFTTDTVKLSAEYARNFDGDRAFNDINQDMVKVDAAFNMGALTPRAQYYRNNSSDSDDGIGFTAFGNYRPGLIIGQVFGENALADTTIWNAGLDMNFANTDKLTYSIDLYGFQPVDHLKDWTAFEGDLWVKYAHNKNVELHAAIGGVKEPGMDRFPVKVQSGMLVRF